MSSNEVSLLTISLKQYFYKLKAYSGLLNWLIFVQIAALLFSLGGVSSTGSSNNEVSVSVSHYSSNLIFVFSFFWIWFIAIQLNTKQYKNMETTLVTNRITENLSNIGYLLTVCAFGGVTSSLGGLLLRVIMYFSSDQSLIILDGFYIVYSDLFLGMVVGILYMVLISAISYLIGIISRISMVIGAITIALIIGLLRVYTNLAQIAFEFIAFEVSFPLFTLKVITISFVLFGVGMLLSNRREVNQ